MRARWLVLVVLVAGSALVAFSGLGDQRGERLLLIGDSITEQSTQVLEFGLRAAGWDATVEGHTGSAIIGTGLSVDWRTRLPELVQQMRPGVVVVELGTNDSGQSAADVARGIDTLMGSLRAVARVVWVNVQRVTGTSGLVNEQLRQATVRWPNLEVLDMAGHFAGHPEWLADGLHPSNPGKAEYAVLVADALDRPPSRVGALSPV